MIAPEDRMFLMNALIAMHHSNESKCKFVLDKANNDKILEIVKKIGKEEMNKEITRLRKGLGYEV